MAACDNNSSINDFLDLPLCEIAPWLDVLNEQQKAKLEAIKKALKRR